MTPGRADAAPPGDLRRTERRERMPAASLTILFLTVFVDLVGFGVVLPLLPFYADRFGTTGLVVGLLVMVYSLAQMFMAPVWGRLSDRFGRRPILLVGLVSSAASYVVFAFAGSLAVLFASRLLAGLGGATVTVAQAYIADVTPADRRASGMGLIGAAFGLGFIFGPALGGLLAPISVAAPGLAAAALCGANAVLAFFWLPESLPPGERKRRRARRSPASRQELLAAASSGPVLRILALSFFFTTAFATMQPTFPLLGAGRFGLDERSVAWLYAFLGLVSAVVQGWLVRRLVPLLGEVNLIRLCGGPFVAGLLLIALAPTVQLLLVALALLAVGFGGTLPSVVSLLSRGVDPALQGGVLGLGRSVGSAAWVVGPVMAGLSFDHLGMAWPYLAGAAVATLALAASFTLREPTGERDASSLAVTIPR